MNVKELWNKLKNSPGIKHLYFQIDHENILDDNENLKGQFDLGKHYFEVRIVSHFLKDRREYWNNYNPLTVVLTEFSYAGAKHTIPFVVGPKLLSKLEQVNDSHEVSYYNTRVVGPTPYNGDQVSLFTGLFRMKTKNWALQALNLLQSVATTFDATKLIKYVDISSPILQGLEGFLGMEDMELRLAQRTEYSDASLDTPNQFRPGYWVMIRSKNQLDSSHFFVKNNFLYTKNDQGKLTSFRSNDYIIYSIEKLENRTDFSEFEFHRKLPKIKEAIWDGNGSKAKEVFHTMLYEISISEDFTQIQKNKLQVFYTDLVSKEIEKYKMKKAVDSMFDIEERSVADRRESAGKYNMVINSIRKEIKDIVSLDDLIGSNDNSKGQVISHLESDIYKEIDMSRLDSGVLAEKLYDVVLKL